MAAATTNIELYQRLNTELVSMVEHFTSLVKATKEGLDADGETAPRSEAGRRVPGELLEVLVEKLLAAGHQCIHTVSELKQGAIINDFDTLIANVQHVNSRLTTDTFNTNRGLDHIKREAEGLLTKLEQHYYTSTHKGQLQQAEQEPASATIAELCSQALQMIDDLRGQGS